MGILFRVAFNPLAFRLSAKYIYPLATRRMEADDVVFFNFGYEQDPPLGLPLEAVDEPNRMCIQLYHRTATQADIGGKRVLEVGCGHGGGASYLTRYLGPASYTGMDLNPRGIEYCRRVHAVPGLDFVQGDAQALPFPDESFDAVLNIESSHCYPDFPGFLREVARVLAPGGRFLYADLRNRNKVAEWEAQLAAAPLTMLDERDISTEVERGLEKSRSSPELNELVTRRTPTLLRGVAEHGARRLNRALQTREICYRMYDFVKPA
ncbi:phthiotriol/phenolphthiotriol dimycocerosates methyltransferase [Mycobacterium sp. 3519A]|uniref:phthiotriol/phenolphthiotriol dimycocerosates methyltransferase n=1 Tax=Mycobacterium sp. 3519A TaxID=2057184 RepID=UPI000C7E44BC|nr:class I SAM-dependent methyltransferase [Mycobacterium sp. 3519A]